MRQTEKRGSCGEVQSILVNNVLTPFRSRRLADLRATNTTKLIKVKGFFGVNQMRNLFEKCEMRCMTGFIIGQA